MVWIPAFLWLWCRPVATTPIRPLAWELPYAAGAALEKTKRQKKKKKKAKRYVKRCSRLVIIREIQIKTPVRYTSQLFRAAVNKMIRDLCVCEGSLYTVGENVNWFSHYGKQYRSSSEN